VRGTGNVDPVCGMKVDEKSAASSVSHHGESYYFCGPACRQKFEADPARYLQPPRPDSPAGSPEKQAGEYTCPMHPEMRQLGPGACPKCGMALEPITVPASRVQYSVPCTRRSCATSLAIVPSAAWLLSLGKSRQSRKRILNCRT